jgi:hypothetical protein
VNPFERRTLFFQYRKGIDLSVTGQTFTSLFPSRFTHLKQVVIEPSTLFKRLIELPHLLLGWVHSILKIFMHVRIIAQNSTDVNWQSIPFAQAPKKGTALLSPCLASRGVTSQFDKSLRE